MLIDIVLIYAIGRGGLENVISKVYKGLVKKGHRELEYFKHIGRNILSGKEILTKYIIW